jgi:glutamate/tyrosine decarboxylase-like PLP-dependent enzyme
MQRDSLPASGADALLTKYVVGWQGSLLPSQFTLQSASATLQDRVPDTGLTPAGTERHLFRDIIPALNGGSLSSRYYGFVTGGTTPIAYLADRIVSTYDQNVQVHLPRDTIATVVEAKALDWLQDMLRFPRPLFPAKTFTTGATASNILGLACGREHVLRIAAQRNGSSITSIGQDGLLAACAAARITSIQILTTMAHSSLSKAASILGIGRSSVKNISRKDDPLKLDLDLLRQEASKPSTATILAISCGEVNTGHFATSGLDEMKFIRDICNELDIWIHVDGAFGIFGRILDQQDETYSSITSGCAGLELADSITGDCHKFLNTPYDGGFFFSRSSEVSELVFQNPNAAYLSAAKGAVPSPLNIGIENSRRFRALPVYATLHAYGVEGYRRVLEQHVALARALTEFLFDHDAYQTLPNADSKDDAIRDTFVIVLFRAKDEMLNGALVEKINYGKEGKGEMYVSGTMWEGRKAARIAVSNWCVDWKKDFEVVRGILDRLAKSEA